MGLRMKKSPASIEENANASAKQTRADSANAAANIFHSKPTENPATTKKEKQTMTPEQYAEYREHAEAHALTLDANKNAAEFIGQIARAVFSQLSYDFGVNLPAGIDSREEIKTGRHAIQSGTVHAIGAFVQWDIYAAREFAACILEDVNDHQTAAFVRKLTTDEQAKEATAQ